MADKDLKIEVSVDATSGISEQERYNATLKNMAERQAEAEKSARELADAEAYSALKSELKAKAAERAAAQMKATADAEARAKKAAEERAAATKDLAQYTTDSAIPAVEHYSNAAGAATDKTTKWTASKQQLKAALKGLSLEVPILGRAWAFVSNPITAAIAGIAAGLVIYRKRVEEASHAMARMELPDLSEINPAKISAAAEAYKSYAEALNGVIEKYNAIPAAAQRAVNAITAQAEREKKLVEARKNLELAEAKTPEQRLAIMNRYASFGVETDAKTRQRVIDEQKKEKANLEADARKKAAQAGTIRVATAQTDEQNEGDLKAQADAAKKAIAEARDMRSRIAEVRGQSLWKTLFSAEGISTLVKYGWSHGGKSGEQALADEQSQIETAQVAVDRYNNFMRNKAGREALRDRRGRLITEAGEETGQAAVLGQDIAIAQGELNKDTATNREVARLNALAELRTLDADQDKQAAELQKRIMAEHGKTGELNLMLVEELMQLKEQNRRIEQRMAALSTNGAFN